MVVLIAFCVGALVGAVAGLMFAKRVKDALSSKVDA